MVVVGSSLRHCTGLILERGGKGIWYVWVGTRIGIFIWVEWLPREIRQMGDRLFPESQTSSTRVSMELSEVPRLSRIQLGWMVTEMVSLMDYEMVVGKRCKVE